MKKFIVGVIVFCAIFFLVEKIFYVFLYLSPKLESDKRLEKVINSELNSDLVIFGSSVGARNIVASQIEDSLDISTYNLSYPGSNIDFHLFLLESLLKFNKQPKNIILTVDDPVALLPSDALRFRLDRLYPLAKYNYINDELIKRGEKTSLSKFLILSRFNKANLNILQKRFNAIDTIQSCGSMPISFQKADSEFIYKDETGYPLEEEKTMKVNSFLKFQDICLRNDIKLHIVFSPNYKTHNPLFEKRIRELSNQEVLIYVYKETETRYLDKQYFYDEGHLKKDGAIIFTNEIIAHLRQNL